MNYHAKEVEDLDGWKAATDKPRSRKQKQPGIRIWILSAAVGVLFAGCVFPWGEQENRSEAISVSATGQVMVLPDHAEEFPEAKMEASAVTGTAEFPAEAVEDFENEKIETALLEQGYLREDIPLPLDEQDLLHAAADEFGVDYYLMIALIERETDFRNICGDGGAAYGYCQIWPYWWSDLMDAIGADDLNDPCDNFRTGCAILSSLIEQYGSVEYALTAYNRGTPGVSEYSAEIMERAEVWRNA